MPKAQLVSIKQSRIITMDETPIKAGREVQGKMRTAWFWPVHGDRQEICFPLCPDAPKGAHLQNPGPMEAALRRQSGAFGLAYPRRVGQRPRMTAY
jgi:Transposase IS66 family